MSDGEKHFKTSENVLTRFDTVHERDRGTA